MKLKIKILNINFKDEKTNYCILRTKVVENKNKKIKLNIVTTKGTIKQVISKNDILEIEADYNKNEDCLYIKEVFEKKTDLNNQIVNFFIENSKGIGKPTLIKIFEKYETTQIEQNEDLLNEFKLGDKKRKSFLNALKEFRKFEVTGVICRCFGLSVEQSLLIYEQYKESSEKLIKTNPYKLYFSNICTFKECDKIFYELKLENDIREEALLYKQIFEYCYSSGNVCLEEEKAENTVILNKMLNDGKLIKYRDYIYTNKLYRLERELEKVVKNIVSYGISNNGIIDTTQEDAIQNALYYNISILTGGPGTGKTYTINQIVKKLEEKGKTYCLLAPTGKAADRMSELTNRPTSTIHRKLEIPAYDFLEVTGEITEDYCIVDECSMLDLELASILFTHISENTNIVLVGDVNQLPSVGPGRVFQDLIESGLIKTTKLNKVYRQAQNSKICTNAYAIINNTDLDYSKSSDFEFIETDDIDYIQNYIKDNYNANTQILSSQHNSNLGTDVLNLIIQDKEEKGFFINDKVMQNVNNYDLEVFNGNLGTITNVEDEVINGEMQHLITVYYENIDKVVVYDNTNNKEIELAYALTIHKSQGSEFNTVILPIFDCLEFMFNKNLLYTAFTRAKKKLILIGKKEVLERTRNIEVIRISNLFK